MSERLDKATRRRAPVRAFLHYVDRLAKAKRRGTNPRNNEAVIAADLADIRMMNRVDPATGRPLPRD